MKLLLDQGLGLTVAPYLRAAGFDATHVGERGMTHASDAEIIEAASREDAVIVTLDADFHSVLAVRGAQRPSVIRLRIEGVKSEQLARIVANVASACIADLEDGAFVVVDERHIRVRRLPIRRPL